MAVIGNSQFLNLTDRLACEGHIISAAINEVSSGLTWYERINKPLGTAGDADVESDLVDPAVDLDRDYLSGTTISTFFASLTRDLQTHVQNKGFTDLDDFLSSKDINVHEQFHMVYNASTGKVLDAINVFRANTITMGTMDFTGSGTGTFTDGSALGTGSGDFDADSNSAAQDLKFIVTGGDIGGTDIEAKVVGTDESGNSLISSTVNVSSGTSEDTEVDITASSPFLDVTSVQIAGGTSGDQLVIKQKVERTINECSGVTLSFDGKGIL